MRVERDESNESNETSPTRRVQRDESNESNETSPLAEQNESSSGTRWVLRVEEEYKEDERPTVNVRSCSGHVERAVRRGRRTAQRLGDDGDVERAKKGYPKKVKTVKMTQSSMIRVEVESCTG